MLFQAQTSKEEHPVAELPSSNNNGDLDGGGVRVSCFSEAINDVPVHFQIISLSKQVLHGFSKPSYEFFHFNC